MQAVFLAGQTVADKSTSLVSEVIGTQTGYLSETRWAKTAGFFRDRK